jgi:hypothetical protein
MRYTKERKSVESKNAAVFSPIVGLTVHFLSEPKDKALHMWTLKIVNKVQICLFSLVIPYLVQHDLVILAEIKGALSPFVGEQF